MSSTSPPGDPGCTCFRLRRAARYVSSVYDAHLAPSGIGIAQFGILRVIEARPGTSISGLAELLGAERTTLTRNLALLEKKGLLDRSAPSASRSNAVYLTEQGQSILSEALPLWRRAQDELDAQMGADKAPLHRILESRFDGQGGHEE